ncbi:hypothetical protein P3T76_002306 [Phytophthora citrophthora]|uniref:Uncharacterized protein n=1 Tax=Phytophthora citrophthora TaxID=4793 RepID=A0AAD9GX85_9STRA|nr:hypothetical protein P3T76_002306 [Phytophthora citrophthora]
MKLPLVPTNSLRWLDANLCLKVPRQVVLPEYWNRLKSIMRKLWNVLRRVGEAWISVQVEFQGRYSVKRLSRFKDYMVVTSFTRVMAIAFLSPLPCLLLALIVEAVPLEDPARGVRDNWVFLIRFGFVTGLMVGSMVFTMGRNVPALIVKTRHVLTIAVLSATAAVATLYAVGSTTVFPVPFTMLLASPPSIVVYGICFAIFWGRQFKADPAIQKEMEQQTTVLNCQVSLTLIYPMYIFGFTSFTGVYQTIFVVVLPIIKLLAKNWVSRALKGHNDLKPEAVIFNVEVFNALYIANALQVASTQASTVTIMAVDVLHFWISMSDVLKTIKNVKILMAKIPEGHPIAAENFVQIAMRLLDLEAQHLSKTTSHFTDTSHPTWRAQIEFWVNENSPAKQKPVSWIDESEGEDVAAKAPSQIRKPALGTRVFPVRSQQIQGWLQSKDSSRMMSKALKPMTGLAIPTGLDSIFSRNERALFIRESARVLFITEYVVLVEYVEVVLPIVYCAHHAVVYNLHNRAYYPALASLSTPEFTSTISHVIIYSSLEFASLVVAMVLLQRTLGFSPLRQLSFVLENQAGIIQGKLLILLIYVMQISLVHIGADFSFKFAWLHSSNPTTMSKWLHSTAQRLWAAWISVQVEFQGRYSVDRLQRLDFYSTHLSTVRLVLILLMTPLPSLMISLLKEIPPLNPPEAGVFNNKVFFFRSWLVLAFIGGNILVQMGQSAPRLKLTSSQVVASALLASGVSVTIIYILCVLIAFPLPFGLLIVAPPDVIMITACFVYISGPRWRADPNLWNDVKRQLSVFNCQVALTFIYPIYTYGFVSLTGVHQAMFVVVLPVIQLIAKNWVSRQHTDNDLKPEGVIFIVEVFNALYVSNALHYASSLKTTATIMAIDFLHFWVSMFDVVEALNEVKILMKKIPRGHPVAKENFVQIAMRILDVQKMQKMTSKTSSTGTATMSWRSRMEAWISSRSALKTGVLREASPIKSESGYSISRLLMASRRARVFPVRPPRHRKVVKAAVRVSPGVIAMANPVEVFGLETIFSSDERALFIRRSARVLFITEYIVLIEYAEVVLPIVYSVHQAVLYNMHNRAYYPTLAEMSSVELLSSIKNVMLYSSLEFVSLIMALVVLKRMLGFSTLHQLAFVLETQASMVQSKLTTLFVYVMQVPLAHLGADFSFKFAWLHT